MTALTSSPTTNPLYSLLKGTDERYVNLSPAFSLTLPTDKDGNWDSMEIFTCGDLVKQELKNTLWRIVGFTYDNGLILDVFEGYPSETENGLICGMTTNSVVGFENITRERLLAEKRYNNEELYMHKDGLILFG